MWQLHNGHFLLLLDMIARTHPEEYILEIVREAQGAAQFLNERNDCNLFRQEVTSTGYFVRLNSLKTGGTPSAKRSEPSKD